MTAGMLNWQNSPKAKAILARLTADDVYVVTVTPIVGDRFYAWSAGEKAEALNECRRAAVATRFGHPFSELKTNDDCRAYLAVDATAPSVSDVLAERFGDPARFGTPPQWVINGEGDGNARWQRERAAKAEQVAA